MLVGIGFSARIPGVVSMGGARAWAPVVADVDDTMENKDETKDDECRPPSSKAAVGGGGEQNSERFASGPLGYSRGAINGRTRGIDETEARFLCASIGGCTQVLRGGGASTVNNHGRREVGARLD